MAANPLKIAVAAPLVDDEEEAGAEAATVSVALPTALLRALLAVMAVPSPPSGTTPKEEAPPAMMVSAFELTSAVAPAALSALVAAPGAIPAFFRRSCDIPTSMAVAASWRFRLEGATQVVVL